MTDAPLPERREKAEERFLNTVQEADPEHDPLANVSDHGGYLGFRRGYNR